MIKATCDQCSTAVDLKASGWFGVDFPKMVDGELIEPGVDHEFHFHSAECLLSWVMERSFTSQPSGG